MSDHHAPTGHAPVAGRKNIAGTLLNFWHLVGAELVAEVAGRAGYESIRKIFQKMSGKKTDTDTHGDHEPTHAHTTSSSSIHIDAEGKGSADEQAFMQELASINGRAGITTAQYETTVKWFAGKSKKFRSNFRNGYFLEKDEAKRFRFLARFAKLPTDAARDELAKAAGHEEPVNHAAHEWHKIVHLYEHKIIPGMRRANASLRRFEHQQRQDNPGIARAREGRIGIGWFSVKFDMFKMR